MGSGTMLNVASAATFGDYQYIDNGDGTATITGYTGTSTELDLPDEIGGLTVTAIGDDAFSFSIWGKKIINPLERVSLPESVISIGDNAFLNNQLSSIIIPDSVAIIGKHAFDSNQLTHVTIPNSVTSIGAGAFISNQLTDVTIPDGITTIEESTFNGNQLTDVTIPDSAVSIGTNAFSSNQLTHVTIPNSVTSIGALAFSNNLLKEMVIPESVTSIETLAFTNNSLTRVKISSSSTDIEFDAFEHNQTDPSDLTIIGYDPSKAKTLADAMGYTFEMTPEMTLEWEDNGDGTATIIGYKDTFTENYTHLDIPGELEGLRVTEIGDLAFYNKELTHLTLPDSVTNIGPGAFGDNNLETLILHDSVTSLGRASFYSNQLTHVTLPDSLTSIEAYTFFINEFTSITIPKSVSEIESTAFGSLTEIKILNDSMIIGDDAFSGDTTVIGHDGSTAQQYASENGLTFVNGDGRVAFSPTGNSEWKKEQSVTVAVYGFDDTLPLEYGWSETSAVSPDSWVPLVLESGESKEITCDFGASGEAYVWVKGTSLLEEEVMQVSSVFKVDLDQPALTITPSTTSNTNQAVVLTVQASDEHSGVKRIQNPDGSWVTGDHIEYHAKQNGTYAFVVEDQAGNTSTAFFTVNNIQTFKPVITLIGPQPFIVPYGETFEDPGYTATDYAGADLHDQVIVTGTVDVSTTGSYQLTYTVEDSAGNRTSVIRTVVIYDPEAPVITLKGDNPLTIEVSTPYEEPGYIATDNAAGDLTDQVVITSSDVDPAILGDYEIHYSVTDSVYSFDIVRYVHVVDTTAPIITMNPYGESTNMKLVVGDVLHDPGAAATDNYDQDVTVTTVSTVNTDEPGTYTVTYTAKDSSGNMATATRTVTVADIDTITVEGLPFAIKAGESIPLTVTVKDVDGTTKDITDQAVYVLSDSGSAHLVSGTLTGDQSRSEPVVLTVSYGGKPQPFSFYVVDQTGAAGESTPVAGGDLFWLEDSSTLLSMADDLPSGTTVEARKLAIAVPGLTSGGESVQVLMTYPGAAQPSEDFRLILGVRDGVDATKTGIYTLNEKSGHWEYAGGWGTSDNGRISVSVPHFSTYGVFTDTEGPSDVELMATKKTETGITLSFAALDPSGVEEYRLQRDGNVVATLAAGQSTYTDEGLNAGTRYAYTLVAIDYLGNTTAAMLNAATDSSSSSPNPGGGGVPDTDEPETVEPDTDEPNTEAPETEAPEIEVPDIDESEHDPVPAFSDIEAHWAEAAIQRGIELGITSGYPDGSFGPDHSITRVEFIAMLLRMLDWSISDITEDASIEPSDRQSIPVWGWPYVRAALRSDVVNGYSDGTFRPEQSITRAEMMVLLTRALDLPSADTSELKEFSDYPDIPAWAQEAMASVVEAGYIQGRVARQLAPTETATRAEVVTILVRVYDALHQSNQ